MAAGEIEECRLSHDDLAVLYYVFWDGMKSIERELGTEPLHARTYWRGSQLASRANITSLFDQRPGTGETKRGTAAANSARRGRSHDRRP